MISANEIKLFVEKQQLIERAKEALYGYIDESEYLTVQLYKIQLVINYQFDEPLEYLQILLTVLRKNVKIGEYSFLTTLSGEVMDDSLMYYE